MTLERYNLPKLITVPQLNLPRVRAHSEHVRGRTGAVAGDQVVFAEFD